MSYTPAAAATPATTSTPASTSPQEESEEHRCAKCNKWMSPSESIHDGEPMCICILCGTCTGCWLVDDCNCQY